MRPRLVFDKQGVFVKELIGFAENDVPDSVVVDRPLAYDQINNSLFELVKGEVKIREQSPEELEGSRESVFREALLERLFVVLFRTENRLRVLEGKQEIDKATYRANLKKILGLSTET